MATDDMKDVKFMTATELRQTYIDFFKECPAIDGKALDHKFVRSSPVVPVDDNTLLFANAGMNQFKGIFLGNKTTDNLRAVNSQKCIRAGGKHNDLEDVGDDTYHHTFFEMLGNWSFGDYFKREAIIMAWNFLTIELKLPKNRIYATYFEGNDSCPEDTEARDMWLEFLPETHVIPCDAKDNFWEMGATGPCGPCTELHFDRNGGRDVPELVNADDPTLIEIWNVVFIQYNRKEDGSLVPLPNQHVDTGMGFERLLSIVQQVPSNYDSDIFNGIFKAISEITDTRPYTKLLGKDDVDGIDKAYRVIADHIRMLTFSISDGAGPGTKGRNYVVRLVLRRAARFGKQFMGAEKGFLSKLVDCVVECMSEAFPEIRTNMQRVKATILEEEELFAKTLDSGMKKFQSISKSIRAEKSLGATDTIEVPAKDVFLLYQSYGFPVEMTINLAAESFATVDKEGYEKLLLSAQEESRKVKQSDTGNTSHIQLQVDETSKLAKELKVEATDDAAKYIRNQNPPAVIKAIYAGDGVFINSTDELPQDTRAAGLVLDKTSFYAEAGGQIYDTGYIVGTADNAFTFQVNKVTVHAGFVIHVGKIGEGNVSVGNVVSTQVDYDRRDKIAPNHTFTHILNFALREALPESDVNQKGSLVDAEKMRFDFSQKNPLTRDQLEKVSNICQKFIDDGLEVFTEVAPLKEAQEITALRAVFGETYPDQVRVVSVGVPVKDLLSDPKKEDWSKSSIEFCGGTHLENTSEAKAFALTEESSVATGVRRIEALTLEPAFKAREAGDALMKKTVEAEGVDVKELSAVLRTLTEEVDASKIPLVTKMDIREKIAALVKKNMTYKKKVAKESYGTSLTKAKEIVSQKVEEGTKQIVMNLPLAGDSKAMTKIIQSVMKDMGDIAVMIMSMAVDEKTLNVAASSAIPNFNSNFWVKESLKKYKGKGGGKPKAANGSAKIGDIKALDIIMKDAESYKHPEVNSEGHFLVKGDGDEMILMDSNYKPVQ